MIHLTRINHAPFVLNADRIEYVEATPDTVLTLTNGQKIVVLESVEEVVSRVIAFRREIYRDSLCCPNALEAERRIVTQNNAQVVESSSGPQKNRSV